jgi:hypothetical protein
MSDDVTTVEAQETTHLPAGALPISLAKRPDNEAEIEGAVASLDMEYISKAQVANAEKYQKFVSDEVLYKKYIRLSNLNAVDYPDEWENELSELVVGRGTVLIPREAGMIIKMVGTARRSVRPEGGFAQVAFDQVGREIDEHEADAIEDRINQSLVRHKVWDFRCVGIKATSGPDGRKRLMRSREVAQAEAIKQQDQVLTVQSQMADAITLLTETLKSGTVGGNSELSKDALISIIEERLDASTLLSLGQKKRHAEKKEGE